MKIEILRSAIADLEEGKHFDDAQEPGIGEYFQDCLFSDIESLVLYGGIHRMVFGFHRSLSKRFPYAIYYRIISGELVVVWPVLDCRRDPKRIRKSLGQ